jgi:large subunit ribosomal protein L20
MTSFSYRKIFRLAKGFYGRGKNCITVAANRVDRALQMAYRERRLKKRDMRKTWILSINAAVREHNVPYSRFIFGLTHSNLVLDRKILSSLAINEPFSFKAVVDEVKLQSGLSVEDRPRDLQSFAAAASAGFVALPGSARPSLAEASQRVLDKEYKWREDFIPAYTKPVKPAPEAVKKMKDNNLWDSDWDNDDFWAK